MSSPDATGGENNERSVNVGDVIAGKFRVDAVLGEGGMGVVVAATHLQLRETVALKFLRRELCKLPNVVARFAQEARAAAKLKSEHVARVLDVGITDDGTPFYVLEHLEGRDLGMVLADQGRLPIKTAVEYIIHACDGLAEAHVRGIVHSDIKPENLFVVDRDGWQQIKILDFGISKVGISGATAEEIAQLQTDELIGSPAYMSPEQFTSSDDVDSRTDIWSLGAVLFELIAGTPPYDPSLGLHALMSQVLAGDAPRLLTRFCPDAPRELVLVIDKCLSRDHDARFATAAELAVALLPFAPRRARVVVERAVTLTKASGLAGASGLELPASVYPPPLTSPLPAKFNLAPPRVPKFEGYKPSGERSKRSSAIPPSSDLRAPKIAVKDSDRSQSVSTRAKPGASSTPLLWLTLGAATLAGVIAFSFARARSANAVDPISTAPIASELVVAQPTAQPVEPVARIARLRVESDPPGASVREDGVEVCTATPCYITYDGAEASPSASHMLAVTKNGFRPTSVDAKTADARVSIALEALTPAASALRAHPAAPTASVASETVPATEAAPSASEGFKDLPY